MIYEYQCPSCAIILEVSRKMSDPEEAVTCADCQQVCTRKWNALGFTPAPGMYSYENKK